jgi:hypothetical protein
MSDDPQHDPLEERLRAAAATLPYPPTPDLASSRRRAARRAPWRAAAGIALALVLALAALLAVPEVRGAALRLLQIGVVRVRVEPDAPPPPAVGPSAQPTPALRLPDLRGATSLDAAARQLPFPIQLPAYPPDLGPPALVFVQDLGGPALVLVWADPADPARARLSLQALSSRVFAEKLLSGDAATLAETDVDGARALWVRGPHLLQTGSAEGDMYQEVRLVDGNTLIWSAGEVTYRLETDLSLDAARRVAESLRPLTP